MCFCPSVSSIQNPKVFLTSCFDRMIRVWQLPSDRVSACYQTSDLITALSISTDSSLVAAGLLHGLCILYQAGPDMRLKFLAEMDCRNRKGRKASGRKVTGVEFAEERVCLVTTNDSRVRLMDLQDFSLKQKYKGAKNEEAPIKATFSHNYSHVIMGSDDGSVYIWNTVSPRPECK